MALIFAELHGINPESFIRDQEQQANKPTTTHARSRRANHFVRHFAAAHNLRFVPDHDPDFCPVRATLTVAHCLLWATRSLPLFLLRLRNFMLRSKKAMAWMLRWFRRRNWSVVQVPPPSFGWI